MWGLLFPVLKNNRKAAILSTLYILLFFSYGHVMDIIKLLGYVADFQLARHIYVLPLFLLVGAILFLLVKRTGRNLKIFSTLLNYIFIVLLLTNIASITLFSLKSLRENREAGRNFQTRGARSGIGSSPVQKPDIYYIVLDEYASLQSIQKLYGYSNRRFSQDLEKLGFYVAEESRTRYNSTEVCMASYLNMTFIEKKDDPNSMLRRNAVTDFLKKRGYLIVTFPFRQDTAIRNADLVFGESEVKKSTWINEYYMTLAKTSMLRIFYEWLIEEKYYSYYFRMKTLYILEKLETLPSMKGPKFVYAHISCPHWPFVFDREGGAVDPRHYNDLKNKSYYLNQYIFISNRVKRIAELLIKKSSRPPVIIIQSDHGPRGYIPSESYYRMNVGREWQRIFNAYYLPGVDYKILYPSIEPVNSFRLVFNLYFKTNYALLTGVTAWPDFY